MPGRSKHGTILTVWWFDHGHPTLFSYAEEQCVGSKLKVAIDANVFFQLKDPLTPSHIESQSLLADWMQENMELCITNEILNEIDRNQDKLERKHWRAFESTFDKLGSTSAQFQRVKKALQGFFPKRMSISDESDLRQLAWTIAAAVQFFVAHDKDLLKMEDRIYRSFGTRIDTPF